VLNGMSKRDSSLGRKERLGSKSDGKDANKKGG